MHARIAAALEGTGDIAALAHHYARAGSPKAVGYCVRAAELAEARYAHDVAAGLLTDAVANSTNQRNASTCTAGCSGRRSGPGPGCRPGTRRQAVEYAESLGRDDLMIAAFTAWTEPTPWQSRPYGTVDRPIVDRLSRLLKRTDLGPEVRPASSPRTPKSWSAKMTPPSWRRRARRSTSPPDPTSGRRRSWSSPRRMPGREELCRELVAIVTEHDLPVYRGVPVEVAEQLGWQAPDHVIVPVASGSQLTKVAKGFQELFRVGLLDEEPHVRISGAQAAGCSPVATAFAAGQDAVRPVKPDTIAKSLAIGNPADGVYALDTVRDSGGSFGSVSDQDIIAGIRLLARTEGIFAETAGGVTIASLAQLAASGIVRPDERVVAYVTGNGLKTADVVAPVCRPTATIAPTLTAFAAVAELAEVR